MIAPDGSGSKGLGARQTVRGAPPPRLTGSSIVS
jgi:hypothetical protein